VFLDGAFIAQPAVASAVGAQPVTVNADTYQGGMTGVIIFVFVILAAIAALDVFFAYKRWDALSVRVQGWAHVNPSYAWLVLVLLGALVAHFVGNTVHYPT
jgi:hypothetical protein